MAVNETVSPEQIEVEVLGDILIVGIDVAFTTIDVALELTEEGLAHAALEVNLQYTWASLDNEDVV